MTDSICLIPDSWRATPICEILVDCGSALRAISKINGLTLPKTLDSERLLVTFAGQIGVPLCDADVEDCLVWPNQRYASRAWLKQVYAEVFLPHCVKEGLISPMAEPELVAGPYRPADAVETAVADKPVITPVPVKNEQPKAKAKKAPKPMEALPGWTKEKTPETVVVAKVEPLPGWEVVVG